VEGGNWYGPREEVGKGESGGGGENRRKWGLGMGPGRKRGKEDLGKLASVGGNVHALPPRQQSDARGGGEREIWRRW
jgi:hypothetical protein